MTIMKHGNYEFVKIQNSRQTIFNSLIEKERFMKLRKRDTYHITSDHNAAEEDLYIIVDTENNGFVLNTIAITYNEAIELIKHYE